ncbi:ATP-dependent DNA helicase UvrD2 [Lacibacter luteus]|uniref:ATP-dependent DNA helicase UvrD2 n=1 Tax=Lacibacter luteus TaxID=2508719 RepID=A0A4Q1CH38_9BACT|nr:helix-turn-helix domain-containing protein [Lacibacter luteus]RXK59623.1 ATP-dependent DNA helicase UvrD2 [Lacibacter luteus]
MQSVERNERFELAYRFVTETQESIFLTGKAGTGKTTFLKYLKEHTAKNTIVAAPTGVAAINAGGVTLHSLFHLPFHPFLPTNAGKQELLAKIRYNKQRLQLLRKMEVLVIDEVSMVRCDVMDAIDTILRSVRWQHAVPFGGVQVLFIGDLFQLPPVAQNQEWQVLQEYYSSTFFFDSKVIQEQMPLLIELTTIYRQKEELFVKLLNKVRNNQLDAEDLEILNERYIPGFQPDRDETYITLTSHNNQAELINRQQLQRLTAPPYTYTAKIEGDFPENSYPADAELVLREGAQVMFLKNDTVGRRFFNGKIGVVHSLTDDEIIVRCGNENIRVQKETWDHSRYTLNRTDGKLEQDVLGTFEQYPLRLAWAITIHKSQGLTFEKVMIDAGLSFTSGQVYVALSRCTSLDGIVLLSKIQPSVIFSNQQVVDGQKALLPKGSLPQRFEEARKVFVQQLLEELFSFPQTNVATKQLQQSISKHKFDLNEEAETWISNWQQQLQQLCIVAQKFLLQLNELSKQHPLVEENAPLQKRVQDAGNYFIPRLEELQQQLKQHPLITEHKTAADEVNEQLNNLYVILHTEIYFLQSCKQPFGITQHLKHKLNLVTTRANLSSYAANKKQTATGITNPELYFQLKEWRDRICDENSLPIYMLANSHSLQDICTYLPFTKEHLLLLSGFGKAKVDKYGDEILELVIDYCEEHNLTTNIEAKKAAPKRERKEKSTEAKVDTKTTTLTYFTEGKSITEIATLRNLTAGTIEGHLVDLIKTGSVKVNQLLSAEKLQTILNRIELYPEQTNTEHKLALGDAYSFTDVRAVQNHLAFLKLSEV